MILLNTYFCIVKCLHPDAFWYFIKSILIGANFSFEQQAMWIILLFLFYKIIFRILVFILFEEDTTDAFKLNTGAIDEAAE